MPRLNKFLNAVLQFLDNGDSIRMVLKKYKILKLLMKQKYISTDFSLDLIKKQLSDRLKLANIPRDSVIDLLDSQAQTSNKSIDNRTFSKSDSFNESKAFSENSSKNSSLSGQKRARPPEPINLVSKKNKVSIDSEKIIPNDKFFSIQSRIMSSNSKVRIRNLLKLNKYLETGMESENITNILPPYTEIDQLINHNILPRMYQLLVKYPIYDKISSGDDSSSSDDESENDNLINDAESDLKQSLSNSIIQSKAKNTNDKIEIVKTNNTKKPNDDSVIETNAKNNSNIEDEFSDYDSSNSDNQNEKSSLVTDSQFENPEELFEKLHHLDPSVDKEDYFDSETRI